MTLVDRLPLLLSREPNIRLIIIDSLAALFRSEDIMFEHHIKANTLQYFGFAMHTLCHRYNLAIVCVNQVYNIFYLSFIDYYILFFFLGANSI
jgi:RecA/RadA recombinase